MTSTHMLDELSYALPASAQYMKKREELFWTTGGERLRGQQDKNDRIERNRPGIFRHELLSFRM